MYGVCAWGMSIDCVVEDKGMLGLNSSVNGRVLINVENTNWSQWRYVVKTWFSG